MFFRLRTEAQFVDVVDDVAQAVAAVNLVLDLPENLADFVLDGVRPGRLLLEAVQVGEELAVHEVAQVVPGHRLVVVKLPIRSLGSRPRFPAVRLIEDVAVLLPLQLGLHGLVLLQTIEVLQEQQPRGLLRIVQFGGTTSFLPEYVVYVFERLLKHQLPSFLSSLWQTGYYFAKSVQVLPDSGVRFHT